MYHLLRILELVLIHQRASACLQEIRCYATPLASLEVFAIAVCSKTSNHSVERHVQATIRRTFPTTSVKVGSGPRVTQVFSLVSVTCSGLLGFLGFLLTSLVTFPTCWDGKNLDSPDHQVGAPIDMVYHILIFDLVPCCICYHSFRAIRRPHCKPPLHPGAGTRQMPRYTPSAPTATYVRSDLRYDRVQSRRSVARGRQSALSIQHG
jgi:hypothetical protein